MCAGAIGSPQLLMLSGIGPAGHLRGLGIDPVADLPGVGDEPPGPPGRDGLLRLGRAAAGQPVQPRGNLRLAAQPAGRRLARRAAVPVLLPVAPPGYPAPAGGFALMASVVAPDSRGSVRLASASPAAPPLIDPGFLREPADLERLAVGLALIRTAAAERRLHPARRDRGTGPAPLPATATACGTGSGGRSAATTTRPAPAGSARSPDDGAVVDPELRVHGISGLRVADASVMPLIPNAPLHATVLAVAERAARPDLRPPARPPHPQAASRDRQ